MKFLEIWLLSDVDYPHPFGVLERCLFRYYLTLIWTHMHCLTCLSNCHPSPLLDGLYIISFFFPVFPLFSLFVSHYFYISCVVLPLCLSSLSPLMLFVPLLVYSWFPFSSFSIFVLLCLTNIPPTSCSTPVNPCASSAVILLTSPDVARYGCEERCSDSEMCQSAES